MPREPSQDRCARTAHLAVRMPAVVASFVHGRLARELMIARAAGVSLGATVNDEGLVAALITVAEVRAGGNDPAATFVDSLAAPVVRVRSDQVRPRPSRWTASERLKSLYLGSLRLHPDMKAFHAGW